MADSGVGCEFRGPGGVLSSRIWGGKWSLKSAFAAKAGTHHCHPEDINPGKGPQEPRPSPNHRYLSTSLAAHSAHSAALSSPRSRNQSANPIGQRRSRTQQAKKQLNSGCVVVSRCNKGSLPTGLWFTNSRTYPTSDSRFLPCTSTRTRVRTSTASIASASPSRASSRPGTFDRRQPKRVRRIATPAYSSGAESRSEVGKGDEIKFTRRPPLRVTLRPVWFLSIRK